MQIKINDKMLSIPPYVSTSWSHIAALHMKGGILVVTLTDGDAINIPNLSKETLDSIFHHHALYLEKELLSSSPEVKQEQQIQQFLEQRGGHSFQLAFGSLDGLNTMMQHNPEQSNAPDLPPEILQKVSAIAKIMGPSDEIVLPQAEIGCNCFYCQMARAINPHSDPLPALEEATEEITDADLQFQQWTITQTGENLYSVTNRLDEREKYSVYLGQPIGCTCGKSGCEHILAVLKS